jgi:hypothetical protein
VVVVPNTRTLGLSSSLGGPQTQCSLLPTSMPATFGRMTGSALGLQAVFFLLDFSLFAINPLR